MSWLDPVTAAAGRRVLRLLPAARRDWAEAVWAEAHDVPAGWPRLAWRVGGVLLILREGQMVRRFGILLLGALAVAAAWAAWPKSSVPLIHGSADQGDVIITLTLLAGLPVLTRWLLGAPDNQPARRVRAGCYAAILAIMAAKATTDMFVGAAPHGGIDLHTFDTLYDNGPLPAPGSVTGGPDWGGEIFILFITACYVAAVLALTARRASVAPATLAIGTRVGAPLAAGMLAASRCHVSDKPGRASAERAWQGLAAGLVCNGIGALTVTALGFGTTALMLKSAGDRAACRSRWGSCRVRFRLA